MSAESPKFARGASTGCVPQTTAIVYATPSAHCGAPSMARHHLSDGQSGFRPVGANVVLQTRRGAAPRDCTRQEGVVSGEGPAGWLSGTAGFSVRRDSRVLLALRSLGSLGFGTVLGPVLPRGSRRGARRGELLKRCWALRPPDDRGPRSRRVRPSEQRMGSPRPRARPGGWSPAVRP
jgi:hypothetical protein